MNLLLQDNEQLQKEISKLQEELDKVCSVYMYLCVRVYNMYMCVRVYTCLCVCNTVRREVNTKREFAITPFQNKREVHCRSYIPKYLKILQMLLKSCRTQKLIYRNIPNS